MQTKPIKRSIVIDHLELLQQLDAFDDRMITDDQVDQHLQWNEVDATESLLSFVVDLPCGETPDIVVFVAG